MEDKYDLDKLFEGYVNLPKITRNFYRSLRTTKPNGKLKLKKYEKS